MAGQEHKKKPNTNHGMLGDQNSGDGLLSRPSDGSFTTPQNRAANKARSDAAKASAAKGQDNIDDVLAQSRQLPGATRANEAAGQMSGAGSLGAAKSGSDAASKLGSANNNPGLLNTGGNGYDNGLTTPGQAAATRRNREALLDSIDKKQSSIDDALADNDQKNLSAGLDQKYQGPAVEVLDQSNEPLVKDGIAKDKGKLGDKGYKKQLERENLKKKEAGGETANKTKSDSKEEDQVDEQSGGFFKNANNRRKGILANITKRKALLGGIGGAGLLATFVSMILFLLPMKINHIVENLEDRFMAASERATDRWTERLFSNYVKKHLLPDLGGSCTSTVDRNCSFNTDLGDASPASRLYRAWRDSKFENKLARDYGIEFSRPSLNNPNITMHVSGKNYHIPGRFLTSDDQLFDLVGNDREVRRDMRRAVKDSNWFKQTWNRYKVGKLACRKHAACRCVIACNLQKDFREWRRNKSLAWKTKFISRIITPRSETIGIVMECLVVGGCEKPSKFDKDGSRQDKFQAEAQEKLTELARKFTLEIADDLVDTANSISRNGITAHTIGKIVSRIASQEAGEQTARAAGRVLPIIGWIDMIAEFWDRAQEISPILKRWFYTVNAATMIREFVVNKSHNDEMKGGFTDLEITGSFIDSFGGDAPAEQSPLFKKWITDNGSPPIQTALGRFLPKAFAQVGDGAGGGGGGSGEPCKDDETTDDKGTDICPEDDLDGRTAVTNALDFMFGNPIASIIDEILGLWTDEVCLVNTPAGNTGCVSLAGTYRAITGLAGRILSPLLDPIVSQIASLAEPIIEDVYNWVADLLIGSMFFDDVGKNVGAKVFVATAGGADAFGNDYCHYGLGCKEVTKQEAEDIRTAQEVERQADFAALPLRQRLFDRYNYRSLISRLSLAVPFSSYAFAQGSLAHISNPFNAILSGFSSLIPISSVSAQEPDDDPFTITQYGIKDDDPMWDEDPDNYTDDRCVEITEEWLGDLEEDETDQRYLNDATGQEEHTETHPCKSLCDTITGHGALYTDTVLEEQEGPGCQDVPPENDSPGAATNPGPGNSTAACPDDPAITDGGLGAKYGPGRVHQYDIQLCIVSVGSAEITISTTMAKRLADLLRTARTSGGINLGGWGYRTYDRQVELRTENGCPDIYTSPSSSCATPTARPGYSNHESGEAVDFTCNGGGTIGSHSSPCFIWMRDNANGFGFFNLPSEPWHWSKDGS